MRHHHHGDGALAIEPGQQFHDLVAARRIEIAGGLIGQQQRVAIARAIVTDPLVLLADEPTGNLDTVRSHEIMGLLTRLNVEQGITIVMVTHEAGMAAFAHRNIHFVDGRIAADDRREAA